VWHTDTYWFDVALIATIFAVGNILLGHFEAHRSPLWRLLKLAVGAPLLVALSAGAGRSWLYVAIALWFVAVAVIHGWWLPKHGVNGWTAEPRERYFALRGLGPDGRAR
jgi:hypothetical protein